MKQQIALLAGLQQLDREIQALENQKENVPLKVAHFQDEVRASEDILQGVMSEREQVRKERRHKERELESNNEQVKKYQAQLYEVKTNKEYSALLEEINNIKKNNSVLEDKIISLMEKTEEIEAVAKEKQVQLDEKKKELAAAELKGNNELVLIEERLQQKGEERKSVVQKVEGDLLTQYERIRKGRNGIAFVPVRDNSCQGCHMELPPQVISELMKGDAIVTCESCARLLYWEKQVSENIKK